MLNLAAILVPGVSASKKKVCRVEVQSSSIFTTKHLQARICAGVASSQDQALKRSIYSDGPTTTGH